MPRRTYTQVHGNALLAFDAEANIYSSARQCSAGLSWITEVNMRVEEDILSYEEFVMRGNIVQESSTTIFAVVEL